MDMAMEIAAGSWTRTRTCAWTCTIGAQNLHRGARHGLRVRGRGARGGGASLGHGGKAALLLSGGIDSPVGGLPAHAAGREALRRPLHVPAVHGRAGQEKVLSLAKILTQYGGGMRVYLVPFNGDPADRPRKCPDDLGTVIGRRFMMRIACRLPGTSAPRRSSRANPWARWPARPWRPSAAPTRCAICPCSGRSSAWTRSRSSISPKGRHLRNIHPPVRDCCTVFTPRHPVTHPKVDSMAAAESKLDVDALVEAAVANTERVIL